MSEQTTVRSLPAPLTVKERDRAFERDICNCLELFHVCPSAKCRRGGSCHGEPSPCIERYAEYYSQELWEWIRAMRDAKLEELSPDEAAEETEPYVDALVTWVYGLRCGRYARVRR